MRAELDGWRAAHPESAAARDAEARAYADYHAARYAVLLSEVHRLLAGVAEPSILDVGPNLQTVLLRGQLPAARVDTLGFAHPATPPRDHERHIELDLNQAPSAGDRPPGERGYDLVVVAEVVEHLHVPASQLLGWLGGWLAPGGAIVLQTPNAAALHKRLLLLAGRSPVEPPRASPENPGHLHEYTLAELREQVAAAGLELERTQVGNHFGGRRPAARLYRAAGRLLPASLRHGVTLCARSPR